MKKNKHVKLLDEAIMRNEKIYVVKDGELIPTDIEQLRKDLQDNNIEVKSIRIKGTDGKQR